MHIFPMDCYVSRKPGQYDARLLQGRFQCASLWRWIEGTENGLIPYGELFGLGGIDFGVTDVSDKNYLDLSFGYRFSDNIVGRFVIANLTETSPPLMADYAYGAIIRTPGVRLVWSCLHATFAEVLAGEHVDLPEILLAHLHEGLHREQPGRSDARLEELDFLEFRRVSSPVLSMKPCSRIMSNPLRVWIAPCAGAGTQAGRRRRALELLLQRVQVHADLGRRELAELINSSSSVSASNPIPSQSLTDFSLNWNTTVRRPAMKRARPVC